MGLTSDEVRTFGRVGIQICYDMEFDRGWDELSRQGCDLVAWPTQSPQIIGAISDHSNLSIGLGATLIFLVISGVILWMGSRCAPVIEEAPKPVLKPVPKPA